MTWISSSIPFIPENRSSNVRGLNMGHRPEVKRQKNVCSKKMLVAHKGIRWSALNKSSNLNNHIGSLSLPSDTTHRKIPAAGALDLHPHASDDKHITWLRLGNSHDLVKFRHRSCLVRFSERSLFGLKYLLCSYVERSWSKETILPTAKTTYGVVDFVSLTKEPTLTAIRFDDSVLF